jgi:hypothetical protein
MQQVAACLLHKASQGASCPAFRQGTLPRGHLQQGSHQAIPPAQPRPQAGWGCGIVHCWTPSSKQAQPQLDDLSLIGTHSSPSPPTPTCQLHMAGWVSRPFNSMQQVLPARFGQAGCWCLAQPQSHNAAARQSPQRHNSRSASRRARAYQDQLHSQPRHASPAALPGYRPTGAPTQPADKTHAVQGALTLMVWYPWGRICLPTFERRGNRCFQVKRAHNQTNGLPSLMCTPPIHNRGMHVHMTCAFAHQVQLTRAAPSKLPRDRWGT